MQCSALVTILVRACNWNRGPVVILLKGHAQVYNHEKIGDFILA